MSTLDLKYMQREINTLAISNMTEDLLSYVAAQIIDSKWVHETFFA